ncbi:MAG: flagellar basal body rod protein FlgB [Deltaproteobacteria bacterium]|nr:flagellar basal body rod protein FlgB [Deltaproteobacteria bacterium]
MEAALQIRSTRAELLAGNVANADTPGYMARDIDFDQALKNAIDGGTNAPELSPGPSPLENLRYDENDTDSSQELAKAYQNSLGYIATLKLYGDSLERLKTAISTG